MKNEKTLDLTTGAVWKQLVRFFIPIAAGTCIQQLYNAVDGIVVGKFVGTIALAAVGGSAAQIINLVIGFFVALTAGASVSLAQYFGAQRLKDFRRATGNALAVCGLMGAVIAILGLLTTPWMLEALQTPPETLEAAILYLRIYFLGVPFILLLNMASNALRSAGDSWNPFLHMVIACVTNILLDIVFVVVFHWGVAGVAIATVIAQAVNAVLLIVQLMTVKAEYRVKAKDYRLKGPHLGRMLRLGIPFGVQGSMYSISNIVIQVGVNTLGTVAVAAWTMSSKIDGVYWAVSSALGAAIMTFIGQNIGAGRQDRVKECVKQGMLLSMSTTIFLSVLIMVSALPLLHIFTDDPAVVQTTFDVLSYFVPYYFTWTVIEVLTGVLRGAGDAIRPMVIVGIGICVFRILWMVTLFVMMPTLFTLSMSYLGSWIVTDIALIIYYKRGNWLKRAQIERI